MPTLLAHRRCRTATLAMAAMLTAGAPPALSAQRPARAAVAPTLDYVIGADLSFLAEAESKGSRFFDGGVAKPGLQIFRDHGYNWIRLRLFNEVANSPDPLPNDLAYTIALAKAAKQLGYKFLLDYHYSDTWADGGKQIMPKAWEKLTAPQLVRALEEYTRTTIAAFRDAGVMPDMVQIGNEISPGMVFPRGKLPEQWDTFAALLKAGIRGVNAGRGTAPRPLIMIHIDKGGDRKATQWFFDNVIKRGVVFDVIGQSYYPWWHGTMLQLRENLAFMAEAYRKPIVVVEVAYNWTPGEYVGKLAPFAESPEGQRQFLEAVNDAVMATPYGLGRGVMWWEPAVRPSPIYGRGMFDERGNALPVLTVFDRYTRGIPPK